jgi:hypothetical protein
LRTARNRHILHMPVEWMNIVPPSLVIHESLWTEIPSCKSISRYCYPGHTSPQYTATNFGGQMLHCMWVWQYFQTMSHQRILM